MSSNNERPDVLFKSVIVGQWSLLLFLRSHFATSKIQLILYYEFSELPKTLLFYKYLFNSQPLIKEMLFHSISPYSTVFPKVFSKYCEQGLFLFVLNRNALSKLLLSPRPQKPISITMKHVIRFINNPNLSFHCNIGKMFFKLFVIWKC